MATLDSSIVNIALPTLTKELGTDLSRIKWVVIAYLLVITCLLLPFGRLSDQHGRKPVFLFGFVVFTIGSALCGLSPTLSWLSVFRMVQGAGAAMLMANGPAIITAAFPASERGAALGTLAMVVSAGLVSGPSIGGLLITHLGWQSIFLVNIPVGFLGIYLVHTCVAADAAPRLKLPFDWGGAFLQTILLVSFIMMFDPPQIAISGSLPVPIPRAVMGLIVLLSGALFASVESQVKAPLFDFSLLKNRTFWTANLASFLTFVSYSFVSVLMPFFLEEVMHYTPDKAGLFMTAIPLTIFVVAPISGRLSDRVASHYLSFAGALIGALVLFVMAGLFGSGLSASVSRVGIILGLSSMGLATGLFQSPNNNAIMGAVPHNKLGIASALLATIRNLGLVSGTGLATSLFSWRQRVTGDFVSALHFTHIVAGFVGLMAMMAALGRRKDYLNRHIVALSIEKRVKE